MTAYIPQTGDVVLVTRISPGEWSVRFVGVIAIPYPDLGFELWGLRLAGDKTESYVSFFAAADAVACHGWTQTVEPAPPELAVLLGSRTAYPIGA